MPSASNAKSTGSEKSETGLRSLVEYSSFFSVSLNQTQILRMLLRQLSKLTPGAMVYICLDSSPDLRVALVHNLPKKLKGMVAAPDWVEYRALPKRTSLQTRYSRLATAQQRRIGKMDDRAMLVLPLRVGEQILGTVTIFSPSAPGPFPRELREGAEFLVPRAAGLLRQAALYGESTRFNESWIEFMRMASKGMVVLDLRGKVLTWNSAMTRITGFRKDEAIGRRLGEMISYPDLNTRKFLLIEQDIQATVTTQSGERKWIELAVSPMPEGKGLDPKQCLVIFRDITKHKELEKKQSHFVSIASHELRTPLTAIKGYLSMLIDQDAGELNAKQLRFLDRIYRSTDRLVNLVEDILSVSRIEEDRLPIHLKAVDMGEILDGLIHELEYRAKEKEIALSIQIPRSLLPVRVDPSHLRQILSNIIDNAIKYTPVGGAITIDFRKNKGYLITRITDSGVGIQKEHMPKLFERFERIDNPLSVQAGGSGLGLFIVKSLVERQGGKVWVNSTFGRGTTFSFSLPIYQEELRLFKV